jgi:micrococcal nuclease
MEMKRRLLLVVIIMIGLLMSPHAQATQEQQRLTPATVVRVIDGDTIEAVGPDGARNRVRLIGLDCPELGHEKPCVRHYAFAAAEFTRAQLEGRGVWLEADVDKFDIYNRQLAYVWTTPPTSLAEDEIRECMFNAILLLEGYALTYTVPPNVKYADTFARFQHEAMEAGRGLWGPLAEVIHTIVYVTLTGKKYHADGCRYLAQSRIPMSLAEALWRWYGPCTVCKPVFWMPTGVPCE